MDNIVEKELVEKELVEKELVEKEPIAEKPPSIKEMLDSHHEITARESETLEHKIKTLIDGDKKRSKRGTSKT